MNIDERLESLTERHEALTQTVELLASVNRQIAANITRISDDMSDSMQGIARLLHIAEIHEQRLTDLEEDTGG